MSNGMKELKKWLKDYSLTLFQLKCEKKNAERKASGDSPFVLSEGDRVKPCGYRNNLIHAEAYLVSSKLRKDLEKLKKEYRHRHIAYSQLKGKTRDKIESNPKTAPDENYILFLMKAYREV